MSFNIELQTIFGLPGDTPVIMRYRLSGRVEIASVPDRGRRSSSASRPMRARLARIAVVNWHDADARQAF
jgi:hypothetical protein